MLLVVLQWILVMAAAMYWGGWLTACIQPAFSREKKTSAWLQFWTGLAFLSFLLQILGFFVPLSPWLKGWIWAFLLVPWLASPRIWENLRLWLTAIRTWPWQAKLLAILPIAVFLLKSIGHHEVFDEGAYHLPLIRMWETKGLVPGFANLNGHYGLNSTWHQLSALANLDFFPFWKREFALNGLIAVVLALFSASRLARLIQGENCLAHWLALPLPFFVFRNLLTAPSTDIPAIVATWMLFVHWIHTLEMRKDPGSVWPALVVLPAWITVLKTSSAALLLIPAGMVLLALLEGKQRTVRAIVFLGLCILLPWLLQNWMLSGYAVFPIRFTALGSPAWQVPAMAIEKKFYLAQFGAFAPPASYTWDWFVFWLKAHNPDSRIIISMAFLTLAAGFFFLVGSRQHRHPLSILLFGTLLATILGWFLSITEPRYGFGSLVISALLPVSVLGVWLGKKWQGTPILVLVLIPLYGFILLKTWKEDVHTLSHLVYTEPHPRVVFRSIRCGNFTASLPLYYNSERPIRKPVFCWDCPLPCIPPENKADSSHLYQSHWGPFLIYETR